MIISDTKKFIFVHIPKTGGMSIRASLGKYATVGVWRDITPKNAAKQTNKLMTKHAKARVLRQYISPEKWNTYFSFAVVRNPWSWLVSGYHYAKKDKRDWRHAQANRLPFKDYLRWSLESEDKRHTVLRLGQFDFISHRNKVIVKHIGKLETIQMDFNYICNKLRVKARLGHVNKTVHQNYRQYYDDTTRELVANAFQRDIQYFNYKF